MAIWILKALKTSKVVMHQHSAHRPHTAQGKMDWSEGQGKQSERFILPSSVKVSGRCLDFRVRDQRRRGGKGVPTQR